MQRAPTVVAIAAVQFAGSALLVCFAGLIFIAARAQAAAETLPSGTDTHLAVVEIALFLLAAWSVGSGLGLLRVRVWGLASTLLLGMVLTIGGTFAFVIDALLAPSAPGSAAVSLAIAMLMGLAWLGLGLWWILYLVQPAVRAGFYAAAPGGRMPLQPLSILIIAWALLLWAVPLAGRLFLVPPPGFALAGVQLAGPSAVGLDLTMAFANLAIGIGLLQLTGWARWAAMIWIVLTFTNGAAATWSPATRFHLLPWLHTAPNFVAAAFIVLGTAVNLGGAWVMVYFLWTRKAAFVPAPLPEQALAAAPPAP